MLPLHLVLHFFIFICSPTQLPNLFIMCVKSGVKDQETEEHCWAHLSSECTSSQNWESSCDPHRQHTLLIALHWPQGWRLFHKTRHGEDRHSSRLNSSCWLIYRELSEQLKSTVKISRQEREPTLCAASDLGLTNISFLFERTLLSLKEPGWFLWEPNYFIYYSI